jgi:hypothetical protein
MIGSSNTSAPDTINLVDGVEPVDMIASLESQLESLENRLDGTLRAIHNHLAYDAGLEALADDPNVELLNRYASAFEGKPTNLGLEDISNTAKTNWDKTSNRLKALQNETIEYARVISIGTDKVVAKLDAMSVQTRDLKGEPLKASITIQGRSKYNIDGVIETHDITRISAIAASAFNFYDKSFLKFIESVTKLLDKLSFEDDFIEKVNVDWGAFSPTKWMVKPVPVKEDDRFRVNAPLFRTLPAQGNRALYASGPPLQKSDDIKNWAFMVNMVRDMSFRYYTVPDLKPVPSPPEPIPVDRVDGIQQRVDQLLNLSKRIQVRKGYESKLTQAIRKLDTTGQRIRLKAGQLRTETGQMQGRRPAADEPKTTGQPAVSDIVQSTSIMLNNVARIVVDYNNTMAGILRTIGALVYMAEREIEAYQPPLKKPTAQQVKGTPQ